ncbi:MAG: hypothetical protein GF409_08840 [Candidatus Omnitrophica bacterium]|nr:hypothetical protein [Candidatus Omnitrophota bacterium]
MGDIEGLSKNELRDLIMDQIRELGVDLEAIRVKVKDGPVILLAGEVYSEKEHRSVLERVIDLVGAEAVDDRMAVVQGRYGDFEEDEDEYGEDAFRDEDNDYMGTEDVFRSIEDGIPYIPPTRPSYQKSEEPYQWTKSKKKRR